MPEPPLAIGAPPPPPVFAVPAVCDLNGVGEAGPDGFPSAPLPYPPPPIGAEFLGPLSAG